MSTETSITRGAKPRISFLGLGNMGSRMAMRLLDAGFPLTVYNRNRAKTELLAASGARVGATPREAAFGADIVISMLENDTAVRAVIFGDDGALSGMGAGATLVEMSTVDPQTARDVAAAATARGVASLDAPVSGSTPQAEEGQLIIFVGGDAATLEKCKPIFGVLGKATHHLGESGAGATMKIVNNCLLGVGMQAIAEAIALGQKAGIDAGLLLNVLGETTVVAPAHLGKLKNAESDTFDAAFPIRLMHKDFGLALSMAARLCVPMPTTAVAEQLCAAELAKGQEEDFSATIRLMRDLARV